MFLYVKLPKFKPRRKSKLQKRPIRRGKLKKEFIEIEFIEPQFPRGSNERIPSLGVDEYVYETKRNRKYQGKMAEREKLAQKEIERRKTQVAPICNKAGYVYIDPNAPDYIIKNLGRKI